YIYRDAGPRRTPTPDAGVPPEPPPADDAGFASATEVLAFLEGKVLLMQGDQIPTYPNGYDENINYGQATQCIHTVRMSIGSGQFDVATELGTLMNAPNSGDRGTCDRVTPSGTDLMFDTTAVLVENVGGGGDCFDLTLTYAGFGQEGRG